MEDFVTFEIAKKLKEKGFKEQCLAYYTKDSDFYYNTSYGSDVENAFKSFNSRSNHICGKRIDAPIICQVLKWLREEKKIHIGIGYSPRKKWRYVVMYMDDRFYNRATLAVDGFLKIELAALAGIEYSLDNLI